MSSNPEADGAVAATQLIALAVHGDVNRNPALWDRIDEVARGDDVRETLRALTEVTSALVHVAAGQRGDPVESVLDYIAAAAVDVIAEAGEL